MYFFITPILQLIIHKIQVKKLIFYIDLIKYRNYSTLYIEVSKSYSLFKCYYKINKKHKSRILFWASKLQNEISNSKNLSNKSSIRHIKQFQFLINKLWQFEWQITILFQLAIKIILTCKKNRLSQMFFIVKWTKNAMW